MDGYASKNIRAVQIGLDGRFLNNTQLGGKVLWELLQPLGVVLGAIYAEVEKWASPLAAGFVPVPPSDRGLLICVSIPK